MHNFSLRSLLVIAAALSGAGGIAYVGFFAWRGDHDEYFLYLLAIGIGTTIGLLADHRRHPIVIVMIAAVSTVGAGILGNLPIAISQHAAAAGEFDLKALEHPDFYVALEAYRYRYAEDDSAPPFTYVAERSHYSDEEWAMGEARWEARSDAGQKAVRAEWRAAYEQLNSRAIIAMVFTAPWNQFWYLVSAAIASGIVLMFQFDQRRNSQGE